MVPRSPPGGALPSPQTSAVAETSASSLESALVGIERELAARDSVGVSPPQDPRGVDSRKRPRMCTELQELELEQQGASSYAANSQEPTLAARSSRKDPATGQIAPDPLALPLPPATVARPSTATAGALTHDHAARPVAAAAHATVIRCDVCFRDVRGLPRTPNAGRPFTVQVFDMFGLVDQFFREAGFPYYLWKSDWTLSTNVGTFTGPFDDSEPQFGITATDYDCQDDSGIHAGSCTMKSPVVFGADIGRGTLKTTRGILKASSRTPPYMDVRASFDVGTALGDFKQRGSRIFPSSSDMRSWCEGVRGQRVERQLELSEEDRIHADDPAQQKAAKVREANRAASKRRYYRQQCSSCDMRTQSWCARHAGTDWS
jgi:hypothetical protein